MPCHASAPQNPRQLRPPLPVPFALSPPHARSSSAPHSGASRMTLRPCAKKRSSRSSIFSRYQRRILSGLPIPIPRDTDGFCAGRSSRCIPPPSHRYFDASQHICCAAPQCCPPRAESSFGRCGVDSSDRTWTRNFARAAPLGTPRGSSARAVQWWWVGSPSSHDAAAQPRCQGTGSRIKCPSCPRQRQP
jgi:hypothetical protein